MIVSFIIEIYIAQLVKNYKAISYIKHNFIFHFYFIKIPALLSIQLIAFTLILLKHPHFCINIIRALPTYCYFIIFFI